MEDFERSYTHECLHPGTKPPTRREGKTRHQSTHITPAEAHALSRGFSEMSPMEHLEVSEVLYRVAARCGYQLCNIGSYVISIEHNRICRDSAPSWVFRIVILQEGPNWCEDNGEYKD